MDPTTATAVVWIVDDCRLVRKETTRQMESLGAKVVCFDSTASAIAEYSRVSQAGRKPDLVLISLEMPSMRGDAAVRTLRSMGCVASLLILAATVDAATRELAWRCGASGVVIRPADEGLIKAALRAAA